MTLPEEGLALLKNLSYYQFARLSCEDTLVFTELAGKAIVSSSPGELLAALDVD